MSNVLFGILVLISVIVGVWYMRLGYQARTHLNENASEVDRSRGWLFWWSFAPHKYDAEGQRLCKKGQVLAIMIFGLYALWFVVLKR